MTGAILVLGKDGQLGRALVAALGDKAHAAGRQEADLASKDFIPMLDAFAKGHTYTAVINAAAYTQVDKAEDEGKKESFRVNGEAVAELARWCRARNLPLVHYSTDYVFADGGLNPHREDEFPNPLNAYGQSKLEGEKAIIAAGIHYLLIRTSWVYDAQGKNFFNTMLRLFGEKESLKVVADQIGAPTYAPHLAEASIKALTAALAMGKFPSGIYHLVGSGETSWYGFAQAIFELARSLDSGQKSSIRCKTIYPIPTSEYPLPAQRPLNSRMDCAKAAKIFGVEMPDWVAGLKDCFEVKYASSTMPDTGSQNHPA